MSSSQKSRVSLVETPPECCGQRIDNFLQRTLKGVPRSMVYRILRQGQVRVNRSRVKPDYRLQTGDRVRIPPLRLELVPEKPLPPQKLLSRLSEAIVLENQDIIVLDKPSGLAVHGGSGVPYGVIDVMRALYPKAPFLELAHRLDRETSGCLILAKSPEALRKIHAALRYGAVEKRYLALLRGQWRLGAGHVSLPLRKRTVQGRERMVEVDEQGKVARSHFRAVNLFAQASLMEVAIDTGRTHQIRVHAAHLGHPVAGDDKYGDGAFNRTMRRLGLNRLFLHAQSLCLPLGGREIVVSAPLSEHLKAVLNELEQSR